MTDWIDAAARIRPRTGLFIDGEFGPASSGETFETRSPRDGSVVAAVSAAGEPDVDRAVRSALSAFERGHWSRADRRQRQKVLIRLSELILENADELALLESIDSGHPISDALRVDVPTAARVFRWYGELLDKVHEEIAPTDARSLALITREPLGVVGAVVPWNYPLIISSWKLAPALAAGNSVVLKPAELTSLSSLRLAELAHEAGVPAGVLNVVPGLGEIAGRALGRHPLVDKIAFTGSPEVGRAFLGYAGESNGKQVSLELGGKSAQVVLDDVADIDACAEAVAWGIFYNAGQTCHGGSRLIVHEKVRDELVDAVLRVGSGIRVGDPLRVDTQIGAIASSEQLDRVLGYIELARSEGSAIRGGSRLTPEGLPEGFYVEPTVLEGVSTRSRVYREEIFGPVLTVTTVSTLEEAVAAANDTNFGLAASVWTSNITVGHRVARALRAGTVWINTFDVSDVVTPFGGFKDSGSGRDRGVQALHAYTGLKTTWLDLGDDSGAL